MNTLQKKDSIPFYLITGFLGSGKTTLLANILYEYSTVKRIAVIQNEFAPTGTDGKNLKLSGKTFYLEEINNGSVFCVCLMASFLQTIDKIITQYDPQMVFLEASGLSDPLNILELLEDERFKGRLYSARIFTVVDALNFQNGMSAFPGFRHQIMVADTVIINKTDIAENKTADVRSKVKALNPFAGIIETSWCQINICSLIDENNFHQRSASQFTNHESAGRPAINVCVMRTHKKISLQSLEIFLKALSQQTFRAKGHVNLVDNSIMGVQSVFGKWEAEHIPEYTGPTEIIAFSETLSPATLKKLFNDYTTS